MSDNRAHAKSAGQPTWLVVTRREFLERVRTKWFIIVTLLGPIGLIGILLVPAYLSAKSAETEVDIAVVDKSPDKLGQALRGGALPDNYKLEMVALDTTRETLNARLRTEDIDGFLWIPENALTGGQVVYEGANTGNVGFVARLQGFINSAGFAIRASKAGISPIQLAEFGKPIDFTAKHNTGEDEATSGAGALILGIAVMFLLYMAIIFYAVNVMRSVVLEKTSRVVEIMVSAVKPRSLMLGKVLGVGMVGLLQLGIWAAVGLLLLEYYSQILGAFGVDAPSDLPVPAVRVVDLAVVLAYFFAGYFFYAALFAAIGAMVNSDQEAQQAQMPVMLLIIIPVLCFQLVINDPRGMAAEIFTLIPFSSPILMPLRYLLGGASAGDVVLSLALLLAALAGAVFLAGRIYRVGILMYGKRPSFREVARWLRH